MKKLFVTLTLLSLIWSVTAQNIYVLGDYIVNEWSQNGREEVAAVYKNGELLYTTPANNTIVFPKTILCDSNENVYWMVNYSGHSEIWKNDQLFVTTKDTNKSLGNMFLSHDTLYYAGSETIEGVPVAKIWKSEDFTPHRTIGNGIHPSAIRNLHKDETTGTIYYCGYIRPDTSKLPAIWKETDLLYSLPSATDFEAQEICIDHGSIYTFNTKPSHAYVRIYKDESMLNLPNLYDTYYYDFCVLNGDWFTYRFGEDGAHAIIKNGNEVVLDFGYASSIDYNKPVTKIKRIDNDIYATGFYEQNYEHKGTIWKNFEVFQTINHCTVVGDFCYYEPNCIESQNTVFAVYPNPANGVLFVETQSIASLPVPTYRITNLMGQILLQGNITADCQQINIESLSTGMYFITIGKATQKFVVRR